MWIECGELYRGAWRILLGKIFEDDIARIEGDTSPGKRRTESANTLRARFATAVIMRTAILRCRRRTRHVPFHFIGVDVAGNYSTRFSVSGIHIARFAAACPRWKVYDASTTPDMMRASDLVQA